MKNFINKINEHIPSGVILLFGIIWLVVILVRPATMPGQAKRPPPKIIITEKDTIIALGQEKTALDVAIERLNQRRKERLLSDSLDLEFAGRNLLNLLREYSAECEFDSMLVGMKISEHAPPVKLWRRYRIEPTFTGFMKFLEKKYND